MNGEPSALGRGPDGRPRCWWSVGGPEYVEYHDREWGRPQLGDPAVFEHLCLETFQSGLAWVTVLRKREAFRSAFAGFRPDAVAAFGPGDVERLLQDPGIVRNRRKIEAVVANAACALQLIEQYGSLAAFFWRFRPSPGAAPRRRADIASSSPASEALAAELRRRGFRHLGPVTVHAHMQASGLLNDHVAGCWVRGVVEREQEGAARLLAVADGV